MYIQNNQKQSSVTLFPNSFIGMMSYRHACYYVHIHTRIQTDTHTLMLCPKPKNHTQDNHLVSGNYPKRVVMLGSVFGYEDEPCSGAVLTCMPVNVERAFNGVLI